MTRFRDIALDLFRFGAGVYKAYQPRFLTEFVLENMNPAHSSENYIGTAEMQSAAAEVLGNAR